MIKLKEEESVILTIHRFNVFVLYIFYFPTKIFFIFSLSLSSIYLSIYIYVYMLIQV